MRGKLILIEGLDRSGKSTQAQILSDKLDALLIKFPCRETKVGSIINEYLVDSTVKLSDQTAHLLFLANRWELAHSIVDTLNKGRFVVMDRYIYSGIAYSLAKLRSGGSSDSEMNLIDWLYSPDKGLPKPDCTLFLTLDLEELGNRKGWGEERYEKESFQKIVKSCFEEIFQLDTHAVTKIDVNNMDIPQVSELIMSKLESIGALQTTEKSIERFT